MYKAIDNFDGDPDDISTMHAIEIVHDILNYHAGKAQTAREVLEAEGDTMDRDHLESVLAQRYMHLQAFDLVEGKLLSVNKDEL
jgi:hypothetical protein